MILITYVCKKNNAGQRKEEVWIVLSSHIIVIISI